MAKVVQKRKAEAANGGDAVLVHFVGWNDATDTWLATQPEEMPWLRPLTWQAAVKPATLDMLNCTLSPKGQLLSPGGKETGTMSFHIPAASHAAGGKGDRWRQPPRPASRKGGKKPGKAAATAQVETTGLSADELAFGFKFVTGLVFASAEVAAKMKRITRQTDGTDSSGLDVSVLDQHMSASVDVIEVKDTGSVKGMGAFSRFTLVPNKFIGEYAGEVIDKASVRKRQGQSEYLFDLGGGLTIDASCQGNLTRFMNHSDAPNVQATVINHRGIRRVVFHAIAVIEAGVELCYDYGTAFKDNIGKEMI
jgi:hypothetical protein